MPIWTDDRRLAYFVCTFPIAIMSLLPFSSFALDFLIIFTFVWTAIFLVFALLTENPKQTGWILFFGFSSAGLRLVIVGAALRKLVMQGPEFDGQLLRSIADLFRTANFEGHIVYGIFVTFVLSMVTLLVGREILISIQAQLDLSRMETLQDQLSDVTADRREVAEQQYEFSIAAFFSRISMLETKLLPIFLTITIAAAIHFRDRLLPVSVEMSLQTSAIMILSLILCYAPLKLLDMAASREWTRRITGKAVGRINLRFWVFENRFWLMVFGVMLVGISFVPDFPRTFLVILAAASFSAGFLSDVLEAQIKATKLEENLAAIDSLPVPIEGNQVVLQFGRDIWNDYYVENEQELHAALVQVREKVIKESGIVFGEISIEFSQRLRPDFAALLINNERAGKTSFDAALRKQEDVIDPDNGLVIRECDNQLTRKICEYVGSELRHNVPSLSYDPAINHLVRNFEF